MTPEEQEDILQRLERARTIEDEDPEKTPPPVTSPRKLGAIILKGSSKAGPTPPSGADPAPNLKASGLNVWPRPGAPAAPAPTAPAPAVAPSGGSPTPAPSVQQPGPTVTPPVQPSLAPTPVPSVPQAPTPTSTPAVQTPAPVSAPTPPPPAVEPPPVAVEPGKKGRKRGEPKLNDPTKPKAPQVVKASGYFTVRTATNIRNAPSTSSQIVGVYQPGEGFNYDGYVDTNGYRWLTYISYSGQRRYVAQL